MIILSRHHCPHYHNQIQERRYISRPYVVVIGIDGDGQAGVVESVHEPLAIRCLSCERLAPLEELVRGRCEDCQ